MAFNYATAKSKLNDYLTAKVDTDAAAQAITDLGPRPALPEIITSQSDYNTATTAMATWDTDYDAAKATYDATYTVMRSYEFELIAAVFYQTPITNATPNQWVKFTNAGGGVLTYTLWLGCCPTDQIDPENGPMSGDPSQDISRMFCVFTDVEPTEPFIDITSNP